MLCVIQRISDGMYFRTNRKGHMYDNWVKDINEATLYHSESEGTFLSRYTVDKEFYKKVYVEIKEVKDV